MPLLRFHHPLPHQWSETCADRQGSRSSSRSSRAEAATAAGQEQPDDAPMTPVVYLVLWCSMSLGVLRGYIVTDTVAARQTPSYSRTFERQAHKAPLGSPFCATGVDGLPGVSWYEILMEVLPVLAPLLGAGFVMKRGRKMGIVLGCWLAIAGQLLLASAVRLVQLYLGQALVRSASDIVYYLSVGLQDIEIASRTSRGSFLLVHMLGNAMGSCMSAVLGLFISDQPALGWRLMFGVGVLPAAVVLCVVPWMFETPHSLVQQGEFAAGWAALREVRGAFYDPYPEYEGIVAAAARMPSSAAMYWQLISQRLHRPAFLMGVVMAMLSALLNPSTMTYVAYSAFRLAGFPLRITVFITNISIFSSNAIGVFIAVLLVDVVGRLPLLRVSSVISTISLLAMVILHRASGHAPKGSQGGFDPGIAEIEPVWAWMQLAILCVLASGNGLAWSTSAWAVIMESQALPVRPAGVAVCIAMSGLAVVLVEARLLCALGIHYYAVLTGFSLMSLVVSFFLVPETARVPLEQVTLLWLRFPFYKRFMRTGPLAQQIEAGGDGLVPSAFVARGQAQAAAAAQQAVAAYKGGDGTTGDRQCEASGGGDVIRGLSRFSSTAIPI